MKQLATLGITHVLFDLDDTLVNTQEVFDLYLNPLKEKMAQVLNIDLSTFNSIHDECYKAARSIHHVNPVPLWTTVFNLLIQRYPELVKFEYEYLLSISYIYSVPVKLKEGALQLLRSLDENGIKKGIVTNADYGWTHIKMLTSGLYAFFPESELLTVVPPYEKKVKEHWEATSHRLGGDCSHTMIIGDNIHADVNPALELGAYAIFLNEPQNTYKTRLEGLENLSSKIIVIESLGELPNSLDRYIRENTLPTIR